MADSPSGRKPNLQMVFYRGNNFPGEYRGSALQPCMASDGQVWGRPVGVAVTKDGSNSTYNPLFIMTLRD